MMKICVLVFTLLIIVLVVYKLTNTENFYDGGDPGAVEQGPENNPDNVCNLIDNESSINIKKNMCEFVEKNLSSQFKCQYNDSLNKCETSCLYDESTFNPATDQNFGVNLQNCINLCNDAPGACNKDICTKKCFNRIKGSSSSASNVNVTHITDSVRLTGNDYDDIKKKLKTDLEDTRDNPIKQNLIKLLGQTHDVDKQVSKTLNEIDDQNTDIIDKLNELNKYSNNYALDNFHENYLKKLEKLLNDKFADPNENDILNKAIHKKIDILNQLKNSLTENDEPAKEGDGETSDKYFYSKLINNKTEIPLSLIPVFNEQSDSDGNKQRYYNPDFNENTLSEYPGAGLYIISLSDPTDEYGKFVYYEPRNINDGSSCSIPSSDCSYVLTNGSYRGQNNILYEESNPERKLPESQIYNDDNKKLGMYFVLQKINTIEEYNKIIGYNYDVKIQANTEHLIDKKTHSNYSETLTDSPYVSFPFYLVRPYNQYINKDPECLVVNVQDGQKYIKIKPCMGLLEERFNVEKCSRT